MNLHRTRARILVVMLALVAGSGIPHHLLAQPGEKPNILLILADDLGYGDLKAYNSSTLVPTPNLDRLTAEGIRFTNAYCPVAVCSPSRYSLMTGQYSFRSWKKSGVMRNYEPSMIADEQLTLPEMLQEAGYTTAGFGKWHLGTTFPTRDGEKPAGYGQFQADDNGANLDLSQPVSDGPLDHGFDHWLGFSCASECWVLEDQRIMGYLQHDFYSVEAASGTQRLDSFTMAEYLPYITEQTAQYLQQQASASEPFFLYFAPYVPHIPLAVSEQFQGSTEAGLYGDYVHELDYYIGKILDELDSQGLTENTLVLFASDNGSQFTVTAEGMDLENASNSPGATKTEGSFEKTHHPNGKLRGTKWTAWEGGVRTPLLARWPGHFPADRVNPSLFALTDVWATLASLVGHEVPEGAARDSYNLLPALQGEEVETRQQVVVQASGSRMGLRWGEWKYLAPDKEHPEGELYDLSSDESESNNLYQQHPEQLEKMQQQLEAIMASDHSTNRGNPMNH